MSAFSAEVRRHFPALSRPCVFFDNPAGTQVPRHTIDGITRYLVDTNANHGGVFATSVASDASVRRARQAAADFLNAPSADDIVLGPNMTTLTYRLARELAALVSPGDAVVATRLDHDANVSPWAALAAERGARLVLVPFDPATGLLDMGEMRRVCRALRPRIVAVGYASNSLGTVNPVAEVVAAAREAGAVTWVDAVQWAPHGPIDVQALGCDFLVCSAYKFFGPHVGVLWGRRELLGGLAMAHKVRPASSDPPEKFETGTNNYEGISGLGGAFEYLRWVGQTFGAEFAPQLTQFTGDRLLFKQAMLAIRKHETALCSEILAMLKSVKGVRVYGPEDPSLRVPTFSFTMEGKSSLQVARQLADRGIYVWSGNFYAPGVTEALGLETEDTGLVRVGAVHYNTLEEVRQLGVALSAISGSS
ncbi:cysteine desulfurase family protein [Pelomyxa schiedti]|nr:cysteine desulfurase family protein [Pelomyxa schiedti]